MTVFIEIDSLNYEFFCAVQRDNLERIKSLIEQGADIHSVSNLNKDTPLHVAAQEGSLSAIQQLLDYGAAINALNNDNETPLHLAAYRNIFDTVKILLERGANTDIKNKFNQTPSALAYNLNQRAMAEYIDSFGQAKKDQGQLDSLIHDNSDILNKALDF